MYYKSITSYFLNRLKFDMLSSENCGIVECYHKMFISIEIQRIIPTYLQEIAPLTFIYKYVFVCSLGKFNGTVKHYNCKISKKNVMQNSSAHFSTDCKGEGFFKEQPLPPFPLYTHTQTVNTHIIGLYFLRFSFSTV